MFRPRAVKDAIISEHDMGTPWLIVCLAKMESGGKKSQAVDGEKAAVLVSGKSPIPILDFHQSLLRAFALRETEIELFRWNIEKPLTRRIQELLLSEKVELIPFIPLS